MPTPYNWQAAPDYVQYVLSTKSGAVISTHHTPPEKIKGTTTERRPHCVCCEGVNHLTETADGLMCRVCININQQLF